MNRRPLVFLALIAALFFSATSASAQQSCESLASLPIPHVTITIATSIHTPPDFEVPSTGGRFGTPAGLKVSVPFCRVAGFSAPTSDSHIGFEVWLPIPENWNGNYIGIGNPGFIGSISYAGLSREVARGSAAASTDTGHLDVNATSEAPDAWAIGHPEKVADWGHRAVHETAVAAKQLIKAYYGKPEKLSFWSSCHEGGNQALTEAQKYPTDYDGIAAGDPAYYITHLQAGSEYIALANVKDGVKAPGYIPPSKYPVIHRAALDACDALDGVRDGFIEDPTRCHFDPQTIQCPGKADLGSCLTAPQVETAKRIYEGAKFADGKQIYPGFEPGSELGWGIMITGPEPLSINNGFFKSVVFEDPKWDFRTFDVDRDTKLAESKYGAALDSHNPDLSAFKAHGGKLLLYQAWEETAIPPRSMIDYYKNVLATMGGPTQTQDFVRLFMVPGMGMCPGFGLGGNGTFDALDVVMKWRETGVAPDKILNSHKLANGTVDRTHPACPYPQVAIYNGKGDPYDASSFTCGNPKSGDKQWLGGAGQSVKAEIFRSTDAGTAPILVVVLHGDLGASYHFGFAANAAEQIHGTVAAALVRPGYRDDDGDKSDGNRGDATGDNYTPEVLDQLDAAVRQLKTELHPSAVVLVGHSGGAAISADLLARDPGLANAALLVSCPCEVLPWRQHMKTLYPYPQWDQPVSSVSPMDVVEKISPKTRIWLIVGDKDNTAPPAFTERYAAALRKHGMKPEVTVLPGREHDILLDSAVMQQLSKLIGELH